MITLFEIDKLLPDMSFSLPFPASDYEGGGALTHKTFSLRTFQAWYQRSTPDLK